MENSNTNTTQETIVGQHRRTSQQCDGSQISTGSAARKPNPHRTVFTAIARVRSRPVFSRIGRP